MRQPIISRISRLCCLLLLLLLTAQFTLAAEVYIVAHRDVVDKELSKKTVERIFLGKKTRWSNGDQLIPVMLKSGELHERFVRRMLSRDATQFNTYWKQAVFTGRGLPPKSFDTLNEMLDYIADTPGAVGYCAFPPGNEAIIVLQIR